MRVNRKDVAAAIVAAGLFLSAGYFGAAWVSEPAPLPSCEESAARPCFDDFGDETVTTPRCVTYEDDSWVCDDGTTGCKPGGLCD
jgi:hypothetical protein